MLLTDYTFELPEELIAQIPAEVRENSRMLVVDRCQSSFADRHFAEIPEFLRKGDLVVVNNTKVFPARLIGVSETGAKVEMFLIEDLGGKRWVALAKPAKRLQPGKRVFFGDKLQAEVIERLEDGKVVAQYESDGDLDEIVQEIGKTPLPPYIKRNGLERSLDRERYQTVYAKKRGAVAAPTAGLHFSAAIFDRIRDAGADIAELTLHVGYGTFEPVHEIDLAKHSVLPERYEIGKEAAERLDRQQVDGRRIIAVGTTTCRALESAIDEYGTFRPVNALAKITITPGFKFRAVNALLTNFHLPQSSLLILVSTFGGHELIMDAYRHAVESRYRFYSYGDCMFIM